MTAQHFIFNGEQAILPTNHDPALRREVGGWQRYLIGLDPGSAQDPSGVVIIEDRCLPRWRQSPERKPDGMPKWIDGTQQELGERERAIVYADRLVAWRYSEVIEHVAGLMAKPSLAGRCRLVVDASGVGAGIVEMLTAAKIKHVAVTITAGAAISEKSSSAFNVSKNLLVTALAAAMEHGELRIVDGLAMREALLAELASFTTKQSNSGAMVLDAGDAAGHADMAIAAALAWFMSNHAVGGVMEQGKLAGFF